MATRPVVPPAIGTPGSSTRLTPSQDRPDSRSDSPAGRIQPSSLPKLDLERQIDVVVSPARREVPVPELEFDLLRLAAEGPRENMPPTPHLPLDLSADIAASLKEQTTATLFSDLKSLIGTMNRGLPPVGEFASTAESTLRNLQDVDALLFTFPGFRQRLVQVADDQGFTKAWKLYAQYFPRSPHIPKNLPPDSPPAGHVGLSSKPRSPHRRAASPTSTMTTATPTDSLARRLVTQAKSPVSPTKHSTPAVITPSQVPAFHPTPLPEFLEHPPPPPALPPPLLQSPSGIPLTPDGRLPGPKPRSPAKSGAKPAAPQHTGIPASASALKNYHSKQWLKQRIKKTQQQG